MESKSSIASIRIQILYFDTIPTRLYLLSLFIPSDLDHNKLTKYVDILE
jgi:hypothetical protein